jgi:ubiquinone/menaquinone biosynthesis C-methylase UbiE
MATLDFEKAAEDYDRATPFTQKFSRDCIERLSIPKCVKDDKILDIAAGTGSFALEIARQFEHEGTASILATDVSPAMIGILKMKCERDLTEEQKSWVSCHVMDGQDLKLSNESISHIGCVFGIMFFPDRIKGLSEMYRVLRPGGAAAIAVWRKNPIPLLVEQASIEEGKMTPDETPSPMTKIVFYYADENNLKHDLMAAGFKEEHIAIVESSHQHEFDVDHLVKMMIPMVASLGISDDTLRKKICLLSDENAPQRATLAGTALIALARKDRNE